MPVRPDAFAFLIASDLPILTLTNCMFYAPTTSVWRGPGFLDRSIPGSIVAGMAVPARPAGAPIEANEGEWAPAGIIGRVANVAGPARLCGVVPANGRPSG